jgi:hypothetical protein
MQPKNKKQLDLIVSLGQGSKGIGAPEKDPISKFLKKPKPKTMFSKGNS